MGLGLAALVSAAIWGTQSPAAAEPAHAIAMHGDPALPAGFDHLPYADPNAPKGGTVTYAYVGTYDSVNPFIVKSATTTSRGIWDVALGNNVFESLLVRNRDEAFSLYGLLADSVDMPDDRTSIAFTIDPKAHFSDGQPVTVDDVLFTVDLLKEKGRPIYKTWYSQVEKTEKIGDRGIKFTFKDGGENRELPLLIGLMPILPKHAIDPETFDQSTLKPMIGSGPYVMGEIKPGERFVLQRDPNYWGKDLPVKRGFDNFDEIRIDYYRDRNVMFEAFKKGLYDVNPEGDPANWLHNYDFPAAADGRVVKETVRNGLPKGMLGLAMNTRRPMFADVRARKALAMLFDFESVNKNLFSGAYSRNGSFFQDSVLSSLGVPASDIEKKLLAPFPDAVEPDVMAGTYKPTVSDGSGGDRKVLRTALDLLEQAGYKLAGNQLVDSAGQPFAFEILLQDREQEKVGLAYARTLQRIGIEATTRTVDSTQYQRRVQDFDFDVIQTSWPASLSPGNEQGNRWSSTNVDVPGSFNYVGAKSPAIDAMLAALLAAKSQEDFVAAVRALDRVLISGHYVVPLYYLPEQWIAHWARVDHPQTQSVNGYTLSTWFAAPGK
ncbi:ABC transporter substrate-binding protein [Kaistia algarum]|nr:ABC transporter substrate-binding protein [Kaistia algarum]